MSTHCAPRVFLALRAGELGVGPAYEDEDPVLGVVDFERTQQQAVAVAMGQEHG